MKSATRKFLEQASADLRFKVRGSSPHHNEKPRTSKSGPWLAQKWFEMSAARRKSKKNRGSTKQTLHLLGDRRPPSAEVFASREMFLSATGMKVPQMDEFLRKFQALRSTAAAHRKGKKYAKVKEYFSIGKKDLSLVFEDILNNFIWTLNILEKYLLD